MRHKFYALFLQGKLIGKNMINQIELLKKLGVAAFGNSWKASLADSLPVARPTITDWIKGEKPIPVGIWKEINRILIERRAEIDQAISISSFTHLVVVEEMKRKGKAYIQDAFAEYLYALSDDEILSLLKAYKEEYAKLSSEYPNDTFADLATIKDAIDFNICIRDINGNLDLSIAEDCAISYAKNMKLAKSFGLDEEFMIERTKEIAQK